MKNNPGLWLVGGVIGTFFLIAYLSPPTQRKDRPRQELDFRGTGASEEAYWSGQPEGKYISIPGRVG
jgi:hypothetical protein